MVPEDFRSVLVPLKKSNPDEIYFLAEESSEGFYFSTLPKLFKALR